MINLQILNMKILYTSIFCFFLSPQGGSGQNLVYSEIKGGEVTVRCPSFFSRERKIFCRERCDTGTVLVNTTQNRVKLGKYRIVSDAATSSGGFSVTIRQLTKSDSGQYSCLQGGRPLGSAVELEVVVTDAYLNVNHKSPRGKPLSKRTGENVTVECAFTLHEQWRYFCQGECGASSLLVVTSGSVDQRGRYSIRYLEGSSGGGFLFVSIAHLTRSDSGRYRCGLGQVPNRYFWEFEIVVTDAPSTTAPPPITLPSPSSSLHNNPTQSETAIGEDMLLYLALAVASILVLLVVAVLVLCCKRIYKPKEPPEENNSNSIGTADQVYANISGDGETGSAPVETSSVQAATSQLDDEITYTRVKFSKRAAHPLASAPQDEDSVVVYSALRGEAGSGAGHT